MNTKIIGLVIIIFVIASILMLYFSAPDEDIKLDKNFRTSIVNSMGGKFINLSDGYTYYKISGPENGPVAILIHGAGPPLMVWDKQIEAMNKAGIRVLRYDRFGAGYSDRVDKIYNNDLFVRQLFDLIKLLKIKTPVSVVGRSLGSYIANSFSLGHPELVSKTVLVSSSLTLREQSIKLKIPNIPVIGRFIIRILNKMMSSSIENDYEKMVSIENLLVYKKIMNDQIKIIGTEDGMRSLFKSLASAKKRSGLDLFSLKKPILVIWGEQDKLVSVNTIEKIEMKYPEAEFIKIKDAEHVVNFSHPELFNAQLINFLKKSS